MTASIKQSQAVSVLVSKIDRLNHPDVGVVRLVNWSHPSPGVQKMKTHICEAIILEIEANGMHIINGLSEAVALLESNGYTVLPPEEFSGESPFVGEVEALPD